MKNHTHIKKKKVKIPYIFRAVITGDTKNLIDKSKIYKSSIMEVYKVEDRAFDGIIRYPDHDLKVSIDKNYAKTIVVPKVDIRK